MLRRIAIALLLLSAPVLPAVAAGTAPAPIVGLFLTTTYPALTVRAGETATLDLAVRNYLLPPQFVTLSVPVVAPGWQATVLGGGQPVSAGVVEPGDVLGLQLRLEPPKQAAPGAYHFTVEAKSDDRDLKLPLTVTIGKQLPAKLKLTTDFPSLRGTASTAFKYTVTVANDSGHDATINFSADAPKNFEVTFAEAYGTQQITSIPIKAGKSKQIDASVTLPHDTAAGNYKIVMHAKSEAVSAALPLTMTVTGQPRLSLTGEGERLSGDAYAGEGSQLTVIVRNDGSEAAHGITLSATTPDGWKSAFDPKRIENLPAGKTEAVKVTLTPSDRAIAGDYQTTISADGANGLSKSANFRITVLTSTLWGAVGIAVIALALAVVVFAIGRFGRR